MAERGGRWFRGNLMACPGRTADAGLFGTMRTGDLLKRGNNPFIYNEGTLLLGAPAA
jgi:hypothetical protein